jgi:Fe-S oxidoreductase
LIGKFVYWFIQIPRRDKRLIGKNFFTVKTLKSIWECITECLLHVRIFKTNPRLGFMHMSIAFGWFMMILVGKFQSTAATGMWIEPPHVAIFLKYFVPTESYRFAHLFAAVMDFFLLLVLTGIILAAVKRFRPQAAGMKRPTKHTTFDKVALISLWAIFPLRLLAESFTSGTYDSGSFLTGSLGRLFELFLPVESLYYPAFWGYSIALGIFFCAMPFSRYMHIFGEIGLIFLRNWGLKTENKVEGFANFELHSCSRCGMCIDVCQLSTAAKINDVQSVYFLRDERYNTLSRRVANNCLMCGRCEEVCPVLIKSNRHRLLMRKSPFGTVTPDFSYLQRNEISISSGDVAYFAGCMTHLTSSIKMSMLRIFEKADVHYTFIDEEKGACCGRPIMLSGALNAADDMIAFNKKLIKESGAKLLVTSCPICYKFFNENYKLDIPVMHHTEYINFLVKERKIKLQKTAEKYVYHDPCELGRLSGIYEQPRTVLQKTGILVSVPEEKEDALCCGGSLANTEINYAERGNIVRDVICTLSADEPDCLVTACPLCKKTFNKERIIDVKDIAEVVASQM